MRADMKSFILHTSTVLGLASFVMANTYGISWSTVDGGGGTSNGGTYAMSGTIGQPDAGSMLGGCRYRLTGGFWYDQASTPTGPTITQWRSVRMHAGIGPEAIVLNPTASGNGANGPTVETRQGGIQRIEVDFGQAMTLANPAGVTIVGRTTVGNTMGAPVSYTPLSVSMSGSHTLAITFNPSTMPSSLPDRSSYTITITPSTFLEQLTGKVDTEIRSLLGDVTMSGDVNLSGTIDMADALAIKAQVASPAHRALCP